MMEMRRRSTDWKDNEVGCYELVAAIVTDSVPKAFGLNVPNEKRNVPPYTVTGPVCIPSGMEFTETIDLRGMMFAEGIYTNNKSFLEVALLPKRVVIYSFAFQKVA